jgi:phosphoserine phosphatase
LARTLPVTESAQAGPQPLPSWNEGRARSALLDFVARVTREGGPDHVPPAQRIATFDNDGTLWCEHPMQVQVYFAQARLEELAVKDPTLRERQPFKAFFEHDLETLHSLGKQAVFEIAFGAHSGMTDEAFDAIARRWLAGSRHPRFDRLFTQCTYLPQLELLAFLRGHGFKTYIVSGGGIGLMRAFAEEAYGIPPEQVIGSSLKTSVEVQDGRMQLMRTSELGSFDDREVKVQNIGLHIGRRPILAFGNSDGDLAMLRYVRTGPGPRLALLLHHDDADREVAYDREFRLSPLAEALDEAGDHGITVVSMKRDWATVFPPVDPD